MLKKLIGVLAGIVLVSNFLQPLIAANIHIHYFESADFTLNDETPFQIYSFTALQNEKVTLLVYGLEAGVIPAVSIFDINGITVAEDLNLDQEAVAVVEMSAAENGLYTALVSRQTETGGLIRVMLFEGDPLQPDYSFLDTIDPSLPSRAYFAQGSATQPVTMTLTALDDNDASTAALQIFASRGTADSPPPPEERSTPIERISWTNDRGDVFYTLNVRAMPEDLPTSQRLRGFLSRTAQFLGLASLRVDIGNGTDSASYLPRPVCQGTAETGTALLAGPSQDYAVVTTLLTDTKLEIVGISGDYFLVVDLENPQGGSFVLQGEITVDTAITGEECIRVAEVPAPRLTENNQRPAPNNIIDPLNRLEPYDDIANDAPKEDEEYVFRPEPITPEPDPPFMPRVSISCAGGLLYFHWYDLPPNTTLVLYNIFGAAPPGYFGGGPVLLGTPDGSFLLGAISPGLWVIVCSDYLLSTGQGGFFSALGYPIMC